MIKGKKNVRRKYARNGGRRCIIQHWNTFRSFTAQQEGHMPFMRKQRKNMRSGQQSCRGKLREIAGIDRCIPCEPVHEFLRTEEAAGFQAEYHTLETEPGVIMPFYLVRPEKAEKDCPVLIIPHGHGGAKDKVLEGQKEFIEEALEDGFLVVCPDERGSGDRREFTQQGEEPEKDG